jgi:hypothetical protein
VDLPNSEIYFSIFLFTKTLYIFKFGEAHSEAVSTYRLLEGPPNLKKNFKNFFLKKILFLSVFYFYYFFKHFKFGGPATKLSEPTAWLWARQT